ncbi:PGF-CTERM sorting domain-containing protein [Halobacterium sp. CBA1126]|uniref:PGF-CTERM sorting domain-containing protein n=1 Tax=Halobacterium sp. CBA1126 TaxID=2668074 RepID=UPI003743A1E2
MPGFGMGIALIAVLGAALLALRQNITNHDLTPVTRSLTTYAISFFCALRPVATALSTRPLGRIRHAYRQLHSPAVSAPTRPVSPIPSHLVTSTVPHVDPALSTASETLVNISLELAASNRRELPRGSRTTRRHPPFGVVFR